MEDKDSAPSILFVVAWLSINLLTCLFPLLLPSLPCPLLLSSSTNINFFLQKAIDLILSRLLLPIEKSFLHRISFFGIFVRGLKVTFSLYGKRLNHLELHMRLVLHPHQLYWQVSVDIQAGAIL